MIALMSDQVLTLLRQVQIRPSDEIARLILTGGAYMWRRRDEQSQPHQGGGAIALTLASCNKN